MFTVVITGAQTLTFSYFPPIALTHVSLSLLSGNTQQSVFFIQIGESVLSSCHLDV